MRVQIAFLLVALLLMSGTTGLAQGQPKVPVCHMDEDGNLILISIADPALDAHLAHGDLVVGVDVDENCEPLNPYAQAGCFDVTPPHYPNDTWYAVLDGSAVPFVGVHEIYSDSGCSDVSGHVTYENFWYIWEENLTTATSVCDELTATFQTYKAINTTRTDYLFSCYGSP